ncbi:AAA family ATPase [Weissella halotolerans]|nr:SMC family ATPase [Weissella halotolerans]
MRPLKLSMHYFGPYERETVDFTKFQESQLFLIAGPTGAGKTTLFDAMVYCLFGVGTGEREPKAMRSEFAPSDGLTRVDFWFEHQGHYYHLWRSPEQEVLKARPKGPNDTKKQTSQAELAEVDATLTKPLVPLASKQKEVTTTIERLLHLTANQFQKIILLPQNQFREFLAAKSDDKLAILRSLFGSELYLAFTNDLKSQSKHAQQTVVTLTAQRDQLLAQQVWPDGIDIAKVAPSPHEKVQYLARLNQAAKESIQTAELQLAEVKANRKRQEVAFNQAQALEAKFDYIKNQQKQLAILEQDKAKMKGLGRERTKLQWVHNHLTIVSQLEQNEQLLGQVHGQLVEAQQQLKQEQNALASAQAELAVLENDHQTWPKKQARIDLLQGEYLPQAQRLADLQLQINQASKKQAAVQETVTKLTDQAALIDQQQNELTPVLDQAASVTKQTEALEELGQQLRTLKQAASAVDKSAKQVDQAKRQVANQEQLLKQAQQALQAAQLVEGQSLSHRRTAMVAQLQAELRPGEPCPVCGQPYQSEHDQANMVETDTGKLQAAMQEVEDARQATIVASQTVTRYQTELDHAKTSLSKQTDELTNQEATFAKEKDAWQTAYLKAGFNWSEQPQTADDCEQILKGQAASLKVSQEQLGVAQKNATALAEQAQALAQERAVLAEKARGLAEQLAALQKEANSITETQDQLATVEAYQVELDQLKAYLQAAQTKWNQVQDIKTNAQAKVAAKKDQIERLQATCDEHQNAVKAARQELSTELAQTDEVSAADLPALVATVRNTNRLTEVVSQIEQFETQVTTLTREIDQAKDELRGQVKPDLTAMQTQLMELADEIDQKQVQLARDQATWQQREQQYQHLLTVQEKIAQTDEQAQELITLAKVVDGDNPENLRLEPYILRQFMAEVLDYANEHYLGQFSNNRYQFQLSTTSSGRANRNGLDIDVLDQDVGQIRPTSTLSGGESFIAALSIALAMAEVVQLRAGGAQIEALFIDEGFGSLDATTLDQAMEALAQVEASGRLVGVISHVTAMQQQIPQQVKVQKVGNGRSRISYQLA